MRVLRRSGTVHPPATGGPRPDRRGRAMPDLGIVLLAAAVIVAAVYAIYRGLDVRLALLVAAFALAGLGGDVAPVVREFLATFSNEKFVVPICTAMGFAYALRHTECDQH